MCKVSAKLDNMNIRHFIRVPLNFLSTVQEWTSLPFDKILCFCQESSHQPHNCKAIGTQGMGQLVFIRNKRKRGSNVSHDWSKVTYIPNPKPDILGFSYLIRPQHCDQGFFFHGVTFDWCRFCTYLNLAQLAS